MPGALVVTLTCQVFLELIYFKVIDNTAHDEIAFYSRRLETFAAYAGDCVIAATSMGESSSFRTKETSAAALDHAVCAKLHQNKNYKSML